MALIDQIRQVLDRLAPLGWGDLLAQHGIDVTAADLAQELAKPLTVKRGLQGFEDFSLEGTRGIEPGSPSRSLLYHALASPRVEEGPGVPRLEDFPTLAEIDVVENYVFGAAPPTLDELRALAGGGELAVAVFSYEYRPASHTCHKRHADLVFSRTGVSRVGDTPPLYRARYRGFVPYVDEDAHAFRVCPARYGAFLAVRQAGSRDNFCPMRFGPPQDAGTSDEQRRFWMPLHKLFAGDECLRGLDAPLRVELEARHVNEKLRRVHLALRGGLAGQPHDSGWDEPDISNPPFRFEDGLAEWSTDPTHPKGVLVPIPHPLVEPARYRGKPLTYIVPAGAPLLASSLFLPAIDNARSAPEYVHARMRIAADGTPKNLNDEANVAGEVRKGNYRALHYVDYTADGAITASSSLLEGGAPGVQGPVPAYSLVTAPDFFFLADQRELTEWTDHLTPGLRKSVWNITPDTLSDQRLAANLQLPDSPFDPDDQTCTAIVSLFGEVSKQQTNARPADVMRHSHLPDDSAGVFAPGWDISFDRIPGGPEHLAAYGLGSPFPEDAKLCAALSTFWPAAAPDATRTFTYGPQGDRYYTVSPLTDEEIGQTGNLPWDGVPGPVVVQTASGSFAEYESFDHTDYVLNALDRRFSLRVTAHIDADEYQRRVLAMELAYRALAEQPKIEWVVLSFRHASPGDPEFTEAQAQAKTVLPGRVYRFQIFRRGKITTPAGQPKKRRIPIRNSNVLFVDPDNRRILRSRAGAAFRAVTLGPL